MFRIQVPFIMLLWLWKKKIAFSGRTFRQPLHVPVQWHDLPRNASTALSKSGLARNSPFCHSSSCTSRTAWRRLALRVCWRWWAAGLMMYSSPRMHVVSSSRSYCPLRTATAVLTISSWLSLVSRDVRHNLLRRWSLMSQHEEMMRPSDLVANVSDVPFSCSGCSLLLILAAASLPPTALRERIFCLWL